MRLPEFPRNSLSGGSPSGLVPLSPPTNNPGNLNAFYHVPEGLTGPAPLVVVLHGCTQDAAGYDRGSGWSRLADRHGFILLFPEQQRANNPGNCFNWFTANDSQRGMGEAASIKAMIDAMIKSHEVDRSRIFVTGLSAGGAMASVMLAAYPDVFAGGAIIAGIAFGCATDMGQAFDCMGGRARQEAEALGAKVRRASPHKGPWPRVSVWQGTADSTVQPSNADSIVLQWAHVHGLDPKPDTTDTVEGYPHRTWLGKDGKPVIEQYLITGMAHGTPLMPGTGEGESGQAGAHMLDAAISSTDRIAHFWGIAAAGAEDRVAPDKEATVAQASPGLPAVLGHVQAQAQAQAQARASRPTRARRMPSPPSPTSSIQKTIEDALKAAGLLGR
jgi:poly(hydroxyalkanoate) depolymerase family esterase